MKERAKVHKQHKQRVTHTITKRLSNALGPMANQPGQPAQADKRMKDVSGRMVAASGRPQAAHGGQNGGV